MLVIKGLNWAGMWAGIVGWVRSAAVSVALMNGTLSTSNMISLGFIGNMGRATIGLVRFATVGIFNALKGLGALVLSFITGGTASAAFSATASTSFGVFATTRLGSLSRRISGNNEYPNSWLGSCGHCCSYRSGRIFLEYVGKVPRRAQRHMGRVQGLFYGIGDMAKQVFGAFGDLIKAAVSVLTVPAYLQLWQS